MALVLFHTRRVREALKAPRQLGIELLVLGAMLAVAGGVVMYTKRAMAPYQPGITIDLSIAALPKYTLMSLSRGFAAYVLSLAFTLTYGTLMAHDRRAERIMLPALDVLQAIPVLGFLPSVVLAMIALFPSRELGLELACVVMIFTGQAWNMTFSFHGSLKSIPAPLREVSAIHRFSKWQVFRKLEVPAAMIGLVWNSMMSMAGGWFFLTVNEAFKLGDQDYRLPGIGSYMQEAINQGNFGAQIGAIVAMVLMIVLVDQIFWRPIVVWSQRFKLEDSADADKPQSWALNLLLRSRLSRWIGRVWAVRLRRRARGLTRSGTSRATAAGNRPGGSSPLGVAVRWALLAALAVVAVLGAVQLVRLLIGLPLRQRETNEDWLHVLLALLASFARTTSALILSVLWTLPAGILIGRSARWSRRLQPIIQVVASFPAPMLFPLVAILLLLLKVPFTIGCVALMLLGTQWYILFNVIAGAAAMPADLREVASVYGMGRLQRWTKLYLPSTFPSLVTGLVTAAGGAWNATIVSEYLQVKIHGQDRSFVAFGLGSIIFDASENKKYSLLCAGVVAMALFVVMVNRFFWKRMYRLAEERYSLNA